MSAIPPHWIVDDLLPPAQHAALLAYLDDLGEADFKQGPVTHEGETFYGDRRTSRVSRTGLGPLQAPVETAIRARLSGVFAALKIVPFEVARIEFELAAHGDGHFFKPHVDSMSGRSRMSDSDRVATLVYYLHREPRRFAGGELAIHPFGGRGEPVTIDPRNNRLVALPAFAVHEVRPVACPGGRFADSRFAVSAWLHRRRER